MFYLGAPQSRCETDADEMEKPSRTKRRTKRAKTTDIMDGFWPVIGNEAAGYCFDVTKSKNGGVKSIRDSAGEVANSWTSLRDLDDLLSMANQREDANEGKKKNCAYYSDRE